MVLNRTRLVAALILLGLAHWILLGSIFPTAVDPERWFWLGISGIIGLSLGDIFLFQGFAWIGPRLTMLMMSLSPILSTLLAWVFLSERIKLAQAFGIAITLAGVAWVVIEKNGNATQLTRPKNYFKGLLVGLGASACQATGLVLARQGLSGDFPALSGNFMRMAVASGAIWLATLIQGQAGQTFGALRSTPIALRNIVVGASLGPLLGVTLSLFAIQHTEIGVASTLTSLPPIFLLPVSYLVFKERFGWQAIAGTFLAIAGSAILFLV